MQACIGTDGRGLNPEVAAHDGQVLIKGGSRDSGGLAMPNRSNVLFHRGHKLVCPKESLIQVRIQVVAMSQRETLADELRISTYSGVRTIREVTQGEMGRHPKFARLSEIGMVAAPRVHLRVTNEFGPHWVRVQVPDQLQEVALPVAQDGPISSLEQVADVSVPTIEVHRVALMEALHELGKRDRTSFQEQMDVIWH
jgi:hypothetical protein